MINSDYRKKYFDEKTLQLVFRIQFLTRLFSNYKKFYQHILIVRVHQNILFLLSLILSQAYS